MPHSPIHHDIQQAAIAVHCTGEEVHVCILYTCVGMYYLLGVAITGLTLLWSILHQSALPTSISFNSLCVTIRVTQVTE